MAYADRRHLEQRFGADEIAKLAEDPEDPGTDRVGAALADATAVIDGHLGVAYALPLPGSSGTHWPLLREICCDLARAALHDDAIGDRPKELEATALRQLRMLRDGELGLVSDDGDVPPRKVAPGRTGPEPVMTAEGLAGY